MGNVLFHIVWLNRLALSFATSGQKRLHVGSPTWRCVVKVDLEKD